METTRGTLCVFWVGSSFYVSAHLSLSFICGVILLRGGLRFHPGFLGCNFES